MWETIIQPIFSELITGMIVAGISGIFGWREHVRKDELKKVIDKHALNNDNFLQLAIQEGLKKGAAEIQTLIKKR